MSILEEVDKTINGERQDQYGSPEDSFKIIAEYWSVYLRSKYAVGIELNRSDIAQMMTLFKMARMAGQKYSRDNWRDAIGYLAIDVDRLQKEQVPVPDMWNEKYRKHLVTAMTNGALKV